MLNTFKISELFYSIFIQHPEEQNMTYFEHFKHSCSYSIQAFKSSLIFIIHGLCPYLFQKTGSTIIKDLNNKLNGNVKNHTID